MLPFVVSGGMEKRTLKNWALYPSDFLKGDYTFTGFDTTGIALGIRGMIKTAFPNLKEDKFINNSF